MNAIHEAQQAMAGLSDQPVWVNALYAAFLCLTLILIVRLIGGSEGFSGLTFFASNPTARSSAKGRARFGTR